MKKGNDYITKKSYHRTKRDGSRGMIVNGNEIDEEFSSTDDRRYQESGYQHLPNPTLAAHSSIKTSTKIAIYWRRGSIDENTSAHQRSTSVQKIQVGYNTVTTIHAMI